MLGWLLLQQKVHSPSRQTPESQLTQHACMHARTQECTPTIKATHNHSCAQSGRAGSSVWGYCYTCQVGTGPAACTPQHIVGRPGLQQRQHCMWGCWSHMQWNWKCHHQDRPLHTLHNLSAPLQATSSAHARFRPENAVSITPSNLSDTFT